MARVDEAGRPLQSVLACRHAGRGVGSDNKESEDPADRAREERPGERRDATTGQIDRAGGAEHEQQGALPADEPGRSVTTKDGTPMRRHDEPLERADQRAEQAGRSE